MLLKEWAESVNQVVEDKSRDLAVRQAQRLQKQRANRIKVMAIGCGYFCDWYLVLQSCI